MERIVVHSSYLNSVVYDKDNLILDVELKDGKVYRYSGITPDVYANLMMAPSKGQYYGKVITRFPHIRIQ